MDFNKVFDKMTTVKPQPMREQFISLLQKTWANISANYCKSVLGKKRPHNVIDENDIARVELFPDEVRCACYSHMNRWTGTAEQRVLDEWFNLTFIEQNTILTEAFPNGQVYGV